MSQIFKDIASNIPPSIATSYVTDSGTAVPLANVLKILGTANQTGTSGSGNTVTIALSPPLQLPNGSAASPTYSFSSQTSSGMFDDGTNLGFSWQGQQQIRLQGGGVEITQALLLDSTLNLTYNSPGSFPYVVGNDIFISVDTSGGANTVELPNAPRSGNIYIVKDRTGNAGANNLTVTTVGGAVNIDGAATYVINVNFGSASFIFNGTSYEVF